MLDQLKRRSDRESAHGGGEDNSLILSNKHSKGNRPNLQHSARSFHRGGGLGAADPIPAVMLTQSEDDFNPEIDRKTIFSGRTGRSKAETGNVDKKVDDSENKSKNLNEVVGAAIVSRYGLEPSGAVISSRTGGEERGQDSTPSNAVKANALNDDSSKLLGKTDET